MPTSFDSLHTLLVHTNARSGATCNSPATRVPTSAQSASPSPTDSWSAHTSARHTRPPMRHVPLPRAHCDSAGSSLSCSSIASGSAQLTPEPHVVAREHRRQPLDWSDRTALQRASRVNVLGRLGSDNFANQPRQMIHKPCQVRHSRNVLHSAPPGPTGITRSRSTSTTSTAKCFSRFPPGSCGCRWPDRR